jgi:putative acetyltransferase
MNAIGCHVMNATAFDFRLATADDVPALAALYARTARELGPQVYSGEQVRAWQGFGRDTPDFRAYVLKAQTWLAEDSGGPLGFCGIGADGEVHSLYVRADATRRGFGSALLAHALAQARQQGIERLAAWATPFSLPVFVRAGFVLVRSVRERYRGVMFERYRVERG